MQLQLHQYQYDFDDYFWKCFDSRLHFVYFQHLWMLDYLIQLIYCNDGPKLPSAGDNYSVKFPADIAGVKQV